MTYTTSYGVQGEQHKLNKRFKDVKVIENQVAELSTPWVLQQLQERQSEVNEKENKLP